MQTKSAARIILDRFQEKCRAAGGPRPGYVLRRRALLYHADEYPGVDLEQGLESLVEQALLKKSEDGSL